MNAFLNVQDIIAELGVSRSYAYKIIQTLNKELQEQGYLVVSGKVPKHYFLVRYNLPLESNK